MSDKGDSPRESDKHVTNALRRLMRKHHQRWCESTNKDERAREKQMRDNYFALLRDYNKDTK